MEKSLLNFPLFYQELVKQNTPLHQYDAVSILLLGKLRADCSNIVISDQMAAHYVHGKKNIRKEILSLLLQCPLKEIERRIELLGFQDVDAVAEHGISLLGSVLFVGEKVKASLYSKYKEKGSYSFLAELFLAAIKCPVSAAQKKLVSQKEPPVSNRKNQEASFWESGSVLEFRERDISIKEIDQVKTYIESFFSDQAAPIPIDGEDIECMFTDSGEQSHQIIHHLEGSIEKICDFLSLHIQEIHFDKILFVICSSPTIGLGDVEPIASILVDANPNCMSLFGCSINEGFFDGHFELVILYNIPHQKTKENMEEKSEKSIQEHDSFDDIEKIFEQRDAKFLEDSQPPD